MSLRLSVLAAIVCAACVALLTSAHAGLRDFGGPGSIAGQVLADGGGVDGAEVTVRNDKDEILATGLSGESGEFLFDEIEAGIHKVTATKGGLSGSEEVEVLSFTESYIEININ